MEHVKRHANAWDSGPPGLRPWGFAAAAVAIAATAASAQSTAYYGTIDSTDKAELIQWSTHYWARVDSGTLVAPKAFTFTKAVLNDPLFLPVRGARRTLETIGVLDAQACDGLTELQPGLGDVAISDAFREAMKLWQFRTDAVNNPAGTQVHFNLINTAPSTSNTTWVMEGSHLVSTNLPWEPLSGANAAGQMAGTVSTATLGTIVKLTDTAPAIAKAASGVTQAQSLITGEPSHADRFEEGVVKYLADMGSNAAAWRVDATFGVFGSLPLVGVTFDDAFVLLDATDGTIDGPFDLASPLDATVLLAQHSAYAAGTTVRYVSLSGCPKTIAGTWHPGTPLPPGSVPRPPCPLPPGTCRLPIWPAGRPPAPPGAYPPALPAFNPAMPGWTGCSCFGGLCIEVDRGTLPTGGVYMRIRYYNCAGAALPIAGCPSANPACILVTTDWWEF